MPSSDCVNGLAMWGMPWCANPHYGFDAHLM
jgi:hypothetical protein